MAAQSMMVSKEPCSIWAALPAVSWQVCPPVNNPPIASQYFHDLAQIQTIACQQLPAAWGSAYCCWGLFVFVSSGFAGTGRVAGSSFGRSGVAIVGVASHILYWVLCIIVGTFYTCRMERG